MSNDDDGNGKDSGNLNGSQNIIDLAGARKLQKELAKEKAKRSGGSSGQGGRQSGPGKGSSGNPNEKFSGKLRIWHWIQFAGFLVVISYLMTLCSG